MLRNLKIFCRIIDCKKYNTIAKEKIRTTFNKEDEPPIAVLDVPYSRYGGETTVSLLIGSNVGKTGSEYIRSIFQHVNAPIDLELLSSDGTTIVPNEVLLSVMRNGTALHIEDTHNPENKQKSLMMNTQLDLYASVVNCFTIPGYGDKFPPADVVIIMQNNRGDFSKLEYEPVKGVVETLKVCHKRTLYKYIDFAFKYAIKNGRKKITFGHRSDELPLSDGLHLDVAKELHATKYPTINVEHMFITKLTRNLIWNPGSFDILCLDDKYGTFVTTVASAICGGPGLFSASEIGDHHAIFKPLQTKLSITDAGPLSPYGTITTAVNLLQHLGYKECASTLWRGLMKVMVIEKIKTAEFGGKYTDAEVINKLLGVLQESSCQYN